MNLEVEEESNCSKRRGDGIFQHIVVEGALAKKWVYPILFYFLVP